MKTYSYKLKDENNPPVKVVLSAERAKELYEELREDLGYNTSNRPIETIIFNPPADLQKVQTSKSETELYYGSYTGRLFKRSRALGDEGKTWVFSNVENRWENDMTNLYDYELLHGGFTILTEV